MNEELGNDLVNELGPSAKFFKCDVTDTENIAAVVKCSIDWIKETGKPLGGIIPAAGVGIPGLVSVQAHLPYRLDVVSSRMPLDSGQKRATSVY